MGFIMLIRNTKYNVYGIIVRGVILRMLKFQHGATLSGFDNKAAENKPKFKFMCVIKFSISVIISPCSHVSLSTYMTTLQLH